MRFFLRLFKRYRDLETNFSNLEKHYDALAEHIWSNGGFVDSNGVLRNSKGNDEGIATHWSRYHNLNLEVSRICHGERTAK